MTFWLRTCGNIVLVGFGESMCIDAGTCGGGVGVAEANIESSRAIPRLETVDEARGPGEGLCSGSPLLKTAANKLSTDVGFACPGGACPGTNLAKSLSISVMPFPWNTDAFEESADVSSSNIQFRCNSKFMRRTRTILRR